MKKTKKESKWDRFIDTLLFIPELLFIPIKFIFRGVLSLFKNWS